MEDSFCSPKNSHVLGLWEEAWISWRKARKGAIPVPGPIMMMGLSRVEGSSKCLEGARKVGIVGEFRGARLSRKVVATPMRGWSLVV